METLRQEFERYARNGQELGVEVWTEGERDEWLFTDAFGKTGESDSVRIFKSLACRAAAAARLNSGQAGPEDWRLWLRHLSEVDPNFRVGQSTTILSEREFNSLKESGEPTEGYVRETVEVTETHLIEHARLFYSKRDGVDFDQFVELRRATADLPQKGDVPKMPRVGESITKYKCESKSGQLLRIFNESAIRCMELRSLAPEGETKVAAEDIEQPTTNVPAATAGIEAATPDENAPQHELRRSKVVSSAEERSAYVAQGWRQDGYPREETPISELSQKTSNIKEAVPHDATPKPEPAQTKRTKREATADEIADALDGKDAVSYETVMGLLGVGRRQLDNLVEGGTLVRTNDRKITTASVRKYLGPREDTQRDD